MLYEDIKVGDRVVIFMPSPSFYEDKQFKNLSDPTALGQAGKILLKSIWNGENRVWVELDIDGSSIECYPGEVAPERGYTADQIRGESALPRWVFSPDEITDRIYQHEWSRRDFGDAFEHLFLNIAEVRKHLDWLKRGPTTP